LLAALDGDILLTAVGRLQERHGHAGADALAPLGGIGVPALGGAGCGWATGVAFWFSLICLAGWTRWRASYRRYALWSAWSWPQWPPQRALLKLGVPIALSYFVEVTAFTSVALLIANLGAQVVASHQVVINFTSLLYMIPQSLGVALSVRVGHAVGAGDFARARFNSRIGLRLGAAIALCSSLLVFALRAPIAALYSADANVIAMAASLLGFAAVFQLADALQTIASGALRGYKLTTAPMLIHTLSFWGIGLGLGVWLGLLGHGQLAGWTLPLGAAGFWAALTLSLLVAAVLLLALLRHESRRRLGQD
jgi:MATE family multidrug resistance protein